MFWGVAIVVWGCDRGLVVTDRDTLRRGLQSDEQVVMILHRVDELALRGKPQEASALLHAEASPASQRSIALVQGLSMTSALGKQKLQELQSLTIDRSASLERYDQALKSEIVERVVAALEEQKTLDQRGASLAKTIADLEHK